ncbi:Short-N-terminal portion of PE_PGRS9 [Mycobacterium canettii CIPT 140070017]|nr:Short-N-terminal portion of PE_PGRS9 [Mycobacterium canettii CIPT 140070017]
MSFVLAMPEVLGSAATDLAALGSALGAANAAAAAQTTGIVAAAQDEVGLRRGRGHRRNRR